MNFNNYFSSFGASKSLTSQIQTRISILTGMGMLQGIPYDLNLILIIRSLVPRPLKLEPGSLSLQVYGQMPLKYVGIGFLL
jgi:hypothetical protein